MNKCSQCNHPIQSDQKFCTKCGAPLANLVAALMPGKLKSSIDIYEKKIAREPQNPFLYMEYGDLFMEFDIHDKALVQYQKAAAIDNTCIDALVKSGDVCLRTGKFDCAQVSYEDALKIKPDLMEARIGLFSALKGLDKLDEALALGEEIIKTEPELLLIRKSLRDIYLQRNEDDKVIRENLKIISLAPSECEPYKQLAQICEKRNDLSLALDIYRKLLELDPHDKDALFFIGFMYYQEGRYDEAIKCFEPILLHEEDNIKSRIFLSLSYIGIGSYDQAIRTLGLISARNLTVTDADSTDLSRAYYLIGACRLREGNLSDAKNYLMYSLKFRKTEAAEKSLAQVFSIEGDQAVSNKLYENAKNAFAQALDLDKSNEMLRNKLQQVQKRLQLKRMTKVASICLVIGCIVLLSIFYFGSNVREKGSNRIVTDNRKDMETTKSVTANKMEEKKLLTINRDVYLRQSPGSQAPEVGTLTADTKVALIGSGNESMGWNNVRVESGPLQGKVGYVKKSYLSEEVSAASAPSR
ncbi:MAG TPA: tetratricopeptide repeat protein [Bacteroidales bacterium]|nr:tetratricopeptide repeat protein [Bacteroidales bacterium]